MNLEKILNEWAVESIIDNTDIIIETVKISKLHSKYLRLFSSIKIKLKCQILESDKLKKILTFYYTGKLTQDEKLEHGLELDPFNGLSRPLKSELDIWIKSNEKFQDLESKIEYSKICLETIEEIMNCLRWRHSHIKNIIDYKKFESGL